MNALLKALLTPYMDEAGDSDGGGGGAVDRGDDFIPTDDSSDDKAAAAAEEAAAAAAAEEAAAAAAAEEAAAAAKNADKDTKKDDDQPRDKDGKFTKKDGIQIPKARFDEARRKAQEREAALNARIAELERQTQAAAREQDVTKLDGEIAQLEDAYQKQLDEGKTAEAKETMRQIRLKERQIVEAQVEHKSERARQMAVEQFKVDTLIEKLEVDFPVLNPDSDEYDQDTVDEVMLLRSGFEKNGLPSSQAIAKAVKYVLGTAKKAEIEADSDKDTGKGLKAGDKADERRKEQLKKNIDAAKKQAPKVELGVDSDKKGGGIDGKKATEFTEEEFNALPESTKARLRGDFFSEEA